MPRVIGFVRCGTVPTKNIARFGHLPRTNCDAIAQLLFDRTQIEPVVVCLDMRVSSATERSRKINDVPAREGPVVYWMQRDQRALDNWALIYAQELAIELKQLLLVVFCLVDSFLGATDRQYRFMLRGLEETFKRLTDNNIDSKMLTGNPPEMIARFVSDVGAGAVVTDFNPLRTVKTWKQKLVDRLSSSFIEVDAHNIVPCWKASPKQEYAAYTFRPKVKKLLDKYLVPYPELKRHPFGEVDGTTPLDTESLYKKSKIDTSVPEVSWCIPGETAAYSRVSEFVRKRLADYAPRRNDPAFDGQSDLSPYLHFGQLSPQRLALDILSAGVHTASSDDFLEELVVRRELSENFCHYTDNYDTSDCFPEWARKTIEGHREDERPILYDLPTLESADTEDDLWNAAQMEMVHRGKMHGYMRMYWAKKILEWSPTADEALKRAIYLNDKYELDGRDPNGYAGIAWSIGGVHDRAWQERPVFGKVRYMSRAGCERKFKVRDYIDKVRSWSSAT